MQAEKERYDGNRPNGAGRDDGTTFAGPSEFSGQNFGQANRGARAPGGHAYHCQAHQTPNLPLQMPLLQQAQPP